MGGRRSTALRKAPGADALKVADPTPLLALLRSQIQEIREWWRGPSSSAHDVAAATLSLRMKCSTSRTTTRPVERLDVGKEPGGFAVQRSSTGSQPTRSQSRSSTTSYSSRPRSWARPSAHLGRYALQGFYDKQQPKPEHDRYIPGALRCGAEESRFQSSEGAAPDLGRTCEEGREAKAGAFAYLVRRGFGALRTARAKSEPEGG